MWPLVGGRDALWLGLYLLTFALHAVLISFVVAGTGYALVQAVRGKEDDPTAARARDLLPFMLGLGITAGVAPLLFLQLLYQQRFYTANLLLGPRWGAVVPALIVGFYALYVAKASVQVRWRRVALGLGLACFVFVAWSWTEIDQLMNDDPAWTRMYAEGDRIYGGAGVAPRLLLWLGAMTTVFATLSAWWAQPDERRRLAVLAIAGRIVSGGAISLLVAHGGDLGDTHGWLYVLLAAVVVEFVGWLWMWRAPASNALVVITAAGTAVMIAGVVVREAKRLAAVAPLRVAAVEAAGFPVFAITAVIGVVIIAWVVRASRGSGRG
ncbi:MAG: hypothetical protein SFX73_21300 [Kofleriaceae bacterium]|nr:hypothetical protein [Kofleriaceae bacterium]